MRVLLVEEDPETRTGWGRCWSTCSRSRRTGGTGLGPESEPGRGSTFSFVLPVSR